MNVLVISAHTDPKSHVAAIHNTALSVLQKQQHTISVSELYAQGFNPVASEMDFNTRSTHYVDYIAEQQRVSNTGVGFSPDIAAEMEKVKQADVIIIHSQIWWGGVPAILKGWFDRVLAGGFAWSPNHEYDTGLLKGKKILFVAVSNEPSDAYGHGSKHGATLDQLLYPITHRIFGACGMHVIQPYMFFGVSKANQQLLNSQLDAYRDFMQIVAIPTARLSYIFNPAGS